MAAILPQILSGVVLVYAVTSMLAVGLGHTVPQILGPLRDLPAVARALVANFVAVPMIAWLIASLLPVEPGVALALGLLGCAAGAPFLLQLTEAADSDVALSATLLVLVLPVTILYLPLVVPIIVQNTGVGGGAEAPPEVRAFAIATPLVTAMLVPLAIGMTVRSVSPRTARRWQPALTRTGRLALVVLVALTIVVHHRAMLGLGLPAVAAAFLLVLLAFGAGFLLGDSRRERKVVLALGTGQRNIAAATVVATQAFPGEGATLVMVVGTSIVGLLVLLVAARRLRAPRAGAAPVERPGSKVRAPRWSRRRSRWTAGGRRRGGSRR